MVGQRRTEPPITERRLFERPAARIEKRPERRDERPDPAGIPQLDEVLTVIRDGQRGLIGLVRQADHEKDIDRPATVRKRADDGALDRFVGERQLSVQPPNLLVRRFQRHLDAPRRSAPRDDVEESIVGRRVELEDHLVPRVDLLEQREEPGGALHAGHAWVVNHEDRRI